MRKIVEENLYLSLLSISIASGVLWRLEVEHHGWQGLIWLSYFHLAIPVSFCIFLWWGNYLLNLTPIKRILLNMLAVLYGTGMFYLLYTSLTYSYAAGPLGMILYMEGPEWKMYLYRYSMLLIIPFIPVGAYLLLRIFQQPIRIHYLLLSVFVLCTSIFTTPLLLEWIDHKGSHDAIHSVKSGLLIPFWVFGLGLLFIGIQKRSIPQLI